MEWRGVDFPDSPEVHSGLFCLGSVEAVPSCVHRVKRAGLRTQPWGTPVFRMRVDNVQLPALTFCVLLKEGSMIIGVKPRLLSLSLSSWGTNVLKAEQKSTNNNLTYVLGSSRYHSAIEIASSVDQVSLWANW